MYDAFDRSHSSSDRKLKSKTTKAHFSPSFGVRKGLIKDPNWPPAHFPEEGKAMARRSLRIDTTFQVLFEGGTPVTVTGDLSLGGARFTAPAHATDTHVEVMVDDHGTPIKARAEIISCHSKGSGFEYRARIADETEAIAIWGAVFQAA